MSAEVTLGSPTALPPAGVEEVVASPSIVLPRRGQSAPAFRQGDEWPLPVPFANICALVGAFAQAMNLWVVGVGPVHLAQPHVRGVPPGKPLAGKTCAVSLDASK
jgi:hypothetical protein